MVNFMCVYFTTMKKKYQKYIIRDDSFHRPSHSLLFVAASSLPLAPFAWGRDGGWGLGTRDGRGWMLVAGAWY